jgi:hypothetical protein
MIIWTGGGFLVAVIGIGCLVFTNLAVNAAMKDDQFYQQHGWPKLLACLVAALIVWPVGRVLNRKGMRELLDTETGERFAVQTGGGHTLFFIPMEYWAVIFVGLGVVFLFM